MNVIKKKGRTFLLWLIDVSVIAMHIFGGLNGDSFRLNVVYVITAKMPRFESQSKYLIVPNNFVLVSKLKSTLVSSHINQWLVNGRKR